MPRRSLPLVSPYGPRSVVGAVAQVIALALSDGPSVETAVSLGEDAGDWAVELVEEVKTRLPPKKRIACTEGCAHCCHVKVLVTVPEVLRLAAALQARLTTAELDALKTRLRASHKVTRGMTTEQRAHAKRPCPLLRESRCLAYEARPLACRGANSLDASACARGVEHPDEDVGIPIYAPQGQMADAIRGGLANALGEIGLDPRLLELEAALVIALDKPNAGREWAAGRPAFQAAVDKEFEAIMRAQAGRG